MAKGKNYIAAAAKVELGKVYETAEAVGIVKDAAYAKFDETVEVSVKLNVKKNHSIRDTVSLPNQFTAEKKILVFAKGDKAKEALEAGAAYVGDDVLGRRGLMPNPKTRTVTMDIKGALAELRQGRVEYRADKTGVVHLAVGKVSMDASSIAENYDVFMSDLKKKRPSDVKGDFIKSIALSSTMGPGVRVVVKE
jgi:large subunit ribosomal protein L1